MPPYRRRLYVRVNRRLVAGLDLGSTGIKILIADEDGTQLLVRQRPTPWLDGPGGTTELEAATLLATLAELLDTTALELPGVIGAERDRRRGDRHLGDGRNRHLG